MMSNVDLVVTDLDGTLWFGHEETHPTTVAAWRELERRGVPVLVATGRRVTSTRTGLARLGFAPPAVMMNGALVLDLGSGERFHQQAYASEDAKRVLQAFRQADLEPCVYVDHAEFDVLVGERPSAHPAYLQGLGTSVERADLDEIVGTMPVMMFGILGHEPDPLHDVSAALHRVAEIHIEGPDQYGGHSCTATPLGLSKWVGVVAYCTHAGIDPSHVLAIGDGPNDRELLAAAAISVAPADASADALDAAQHIVDSTRVGGWAQILDLV